MSPSARAGLYGGAMALVLAVASGIYFFTTADAAAAVLGLVAVVVFLSGGVLLGVVLAQRPPMVVARATPRLYLVTLTVGLVLVALLILVQQSLV